MKTVVVSLCALLSIDVSNAFVVKPMKVSTTSTTSALYGAVFPDVTGIGYTVQVTKPLGVIFGENPEPTLGLRVDDVTEAQNGAIAGIRAGDQLVAVDGESVVGCDFDEAMDLLINADSQVQVQLFRGDVRSLFNILTNLKGGPVEDEGEEPDVIDENYVPPRIEVVEQEPLTAKDLLRGLGKAVSIITEDLAPKKDEEKKGGFFGGVFSGETIQLEGDDASGTK
mmetsp:Transcript_15994/g.19213  ORF Transcript_15994/g.19213 Transcript_15994/m.19213 type:complete len:225 (-) Transcript_15994:107-781(-)|eukprot:CAMPEP_0195325884 /NCGR_PEP_ID=MMETSP0708-20121125/9393_1 /TAXON_ID=33640 /ORGANISM="Asterionellopsis glacialis, Strain CCMP134" /LENGTH=224 /DNA_ID=CAMNT_0040393427 /DNA_START=49 /DNA_END=723 /DNA_ORIENTATION=-